MSEENILQGNDVAHDRSWKRILLKSAALAPPKATWALAIGAFGAVSVMALTPSTEWIAGTILSFALAWTAVVDADRLILPNVITLPLICLGMLFAAVEGWSVALDHGIGAIVGFVALVSVAAAYRRLRNRSGLGRGDAKFFAAAGAWLSWIALPAVMLVAATGALLYISARAVTGRSVSNVTAIPFGPFLALGFWVAWLVQSNEPAFHKWLTA